MGLTELIKEKKKKILTELASLVVPTDEVVFVLKSQKGNYKSAKGYSVQEIGEMVEIENLTLSGMQREAVNQEMRERYGKNLLGYAVWIDHNRTEQIGPYLEKTYFQPLRIERNKESTKSTEPIKFIEI